MPESNYKISDIYQGGGSSLDPTYGKLFTGYHIPAGELGLTTDFRSANIVQEMGQKLASGIKHIEISPISPEVFESIPEPQLKEARRLAKLTGSEITVHGSPQLEASGYNQQGFTEQNREAVERQMNMVVERAQKINPNGNAPVTFHSSAGVPGEILKQGEKPDETFVINSETGSVGRMPLKTRKFPGEPIEPKPEREIEQLNEDSWSQSLTHLAFNAGRAGEYIDDSIHLTEMSEKTNPEDPNRKEKQARLMTNTGKAFLNDSYRELKQLFDQAAKEGTEKDKMLLKNFENRIQNKVTEINTNPASKKSILLKRQIVEDGIETLNKISTPPQIFQPMQDFAKEKTTQTFANVAWNAYEKVKKGKWKEAPIISIENPPAGGAFSTGEELKQVVKESRKKFVEKAKQEGVSESEAKRQAKKLIGATWDVGHINMLRKYGYEKKDLVKETEKIAPYVKHVHLSDNFGFEHTELPMGMGNVPIKKMMEKLGKEGYEGKKIIEAGHWWQHFKTAPFQETLEAFGSPVYSMQMQPYWNQAIALQQGYFSGYGQMLPSQNYAMFGAGFSQLPAELGGQQPGAQGSRVSGNPME